MPSAVRVEVQNDVVFLSPVDHQVFFIVARLRPDKKRIRCQFSLFERTGSATDSTGGP